MLKILIADDHPIVREGLKQIIAKTTDMTVTSEASDGQEILDQLRKTPVDVILLDLSMPGRSGLDILLELRSKKPKLPILVLSHHPEDQYALKVLKAGASGYLTKGSASEDLITAIRKVARGGKYVSPALAERLASEFDSSSEKPLHEMLSLREYEVMGMLSSGKTVSEIAEVLSLSVKTISTYRTRILEKMKLKNNAEIIRYALEHRISSSDPSHPVKKSASK